MSDSKLKVGEGFLVSGGSGKPDWILIPFEIQVQHKICEFLCNLRDRELANSHIFICILLSGVAKGPQDHLEVQGGSWLPAVPTYFEGDTSSLGAQPHQDYWHHCELLAASDR